MRLLGLCLSLGLSFSLAQASERPLSPTWQNITTIGGLQRFPEGTQYLDRNFLDGDEAHLWDFVAYHGFKESFYLQILSESGEVLAMTPEFQLGDFTSVSFDFEKDFYPLLAQAHSSPEKPATVKIVHTHFNASRFSKKDLSTLFLLRVYLEEMGFIDTEFRGVVVYGNQKSFLGARSLVIPSGVSWRRGDYKIGSDLKADINHIPQQQRFAQIRGRASGCKTKLERSLR